MKTISVSHRKQWARVLLVIVLSLVGMLFLTLLSASVSAWIPILFCWGDILLFSAIPVVLLALLANGPVPNIRESWSQMPWALASGLTFFVFMTWLPTYYTDTERMYELACFGPLLGVMGFLLGWIAQRGTLIMISCLLLPFVWGRLFVDEMLSTLFTISTIIASFAAVFWWNRIDPLKRDDSEPSRIEDILSDPDLTMQWLETLSQEDGDMGQDVWFEEKHQPVNRQRYLLVLLFLGLLLITVLLFIIVLLA